MLKSVLRTLPSITASPAVSVAPFYVALTNQKTQNGDTHNSWQIVGSLSRLEWSL